jgi:allantoinase
VAADLVIRGATVIADGAYARDILISDGRVAGLVEPGASAAGLEIDATGLIALPGVVDAHVHFNDPGRTEWEGWTHGSRAAAAGGVTTVIDMPLNSLPPVVDGAAFDLKRAAGERSSIVDFALWGGLVGSDAVPLRELASRGAVGVKAFLCDSGVPEFPAIADDDLEGAIRAATSARLIVALHAEDEGLVREATARVHAAGRTDAGAWLASRPPLAEIRAVARACAAAKGTGARVHIVHLSAVDALGAIGVARAAGTDISVETCGHYLVFDEADVLVHGPLLKCAPPIRERANRDALWDAVSGGRIDLIASDHSPCSADLKTRGRDDIFAAWGGVAGVQSLLPAVFSEATHRARGVLDPRAIAGFIAWRLAAKPADRFGLSPRKGRIATGSDADIVLFDPSREWTLDQAAVQTRSGLTPYAGRSFTGAVVRTLVRGTTVYLDGEFPATAGHGRFVAAERAA